MGCFQAEKMNPEFVGPAGQEELYKKLATMFSGGLGSFKSPPAYIAGPNYGQKAGMDYVTNQLGYGGWQDQGLYGIPSQNVQMPQAPATGPTPGSAEWLQQQLDNFYGTFKG